ncbi:MAG: hypothetical protein CW691_05195 [Candidatus Bathyarchaeum sp.]|nr:MAG: hypothetical protein CW691_05195 [Candidatus Bathyarchaeum sp.]
MPLKSVNAIANGFDTTTKNLLLFAPPLVLLAIQLLFQFLVYNFPNIWLVWAGRFIVGLIGFIAYCIVVDMTNDAINGQPLNLNKSLNAIMGRLAELILVAIVTVLCALTILLIPLALFLRTITVVEKTDTNQTISKSVDFVRNNLGEVVFFAIIVIIVAVFISFGFSLIPFVGAYLSDFLNMLVNVVFTTASVHLYFSLKETTTTPQQSLNT